MTNVNEAFYEQLNEYGRQRTPCLFVIDFEQQAPLLYPLDQVDPTRLQYAFGARTNAVPRATPSPLPELRVGEISLADYRRAFDIVQAGLRRGDSFLTNLTFPVPVELNGSLEQVFHAARARYRLWLRDRFVCFSPETFVRIADNRIFSYPMKGTAPSDGREALLADPKERAEHATIVDLIRNDLSRVARRVLVEDYRYPEHLPASRPGGGGLWQTSSRIAGELSSDWQSGLGDLLAGLLPAGSVSGAPKPSTVSIIRRAERGDRGYYCGVAGLFDGIGLDSCVLIRFIEQSVPTTHFFRAGGGITTRSELTAEYREMHAKVLIPTSP